MLGAMTASLPDGETAAAAGSPNPGGVLTAKSEPLWLTISSSARRRTETLPGGDPLDGPMALTRIAPSADCCDQNPRGSVARSRGNGRSIRTVGDGENHRPMTAQYLRRRLRGSERPKPHHPVIVSRGDPLPVMIEYTLEYGHALEQQLVFVFRDVPQVVPSRPGRSPAGRWDQSDETPRSSPALATRSPPCRSSDPRRISVSASPPGFHQPASRRRRFERYGSRRSGSRRPTAASHG